MIYPFGYYGSRRRFYTRPNFPFFRQGVDERGASFSPRRPQPPLFPPQDQYLSQPNFQDGTEFTDEAGFRTLYGEDYGGGYDQINREFAPQNSDTNSTCKQYKTLCNYSNRQNQDNECGCDKKCSCKKPQHECDCDKNCHQNKLQHECGKPTCDCNKKYGCDKPQCDCEHNCNCDKPCEQNSTDELNSTIGNMCKCCNPNCNDGKIDTNAEQNICQNDTSSQAQGQCYGGYYGGYGNYNGYNNFGGCGGGCGGNFSECGCGCGCIPPIEPCIPLPPRPPIEQFCPCTPPLFCPNYPLCPQPRPIADRVEEEIAEEIAEENCDRCRFIDRRCGLFGNLFRRNW